MLEAVYRKSMISLLTFGLLGLAACSAPDRAAESGGASQPESPGAQKNEVLLAASSPFEDLAEFATAADEAEMDRTLAVIEDEASLTRSALDAAGRERFDALLSALRAAREAGDYTAVALGSVDAYRVLVEGFDDAALTVPKAVSLLDYVGFRLHILAGAKSPDWTAIEETTEEARGLWANLEGQVEHKGLRDAMNTTIGGLAQAVEARDALMTRFAAQVDLDLVDLLEGYFEDSAAEKPQQSLKGSGMGRRAYQWASMARSNGTESRPPCVRHRAPARKAASIANRTYVL